MVGLNESGKTTVLEAINYFVYKPESLKALELDSYEVEDIHSLIPINKRDNFNGFIVIEAGIELEEDDILKIKNGFKEKGIILTNFSTQLSYTQKYSFKNSIHQKENDKRQWTYNFKGKVGKNSRRERALTNEEALTASKIIIQSMPSILYFPNFLFEFPERIYLDKTTTDLKHHFYQTIIQDVLDSLNNNTNIIEHLINRINSPDDNEKRNLTTLIGKMQKH